MTRRLFAMLDVYQDATPRMAALNMAIDEALLEQVTQPSIRTYRWDHPALSFGYFGKFSDVSGYAVERDIVRRWTGGGIVFHGDDLTYSIIIPGNDPLFAQSSTSIYENIHQAIREALAASGQRAELVQIESRPDVGGRPPARSLRRGASSCDADDGLLGARPPREAEPGPLGARPSRDGQPGLAGARPSTISEACFARPVFADVIVNGQKVAGAAQRRTRCGLLQQGSIQQVVLAKDFEMRFADHLAKECVVKNLSDAILARASEIAARKYGTEAWLRKRG
jgi:lipoate-protein ligase A